MTPAGASCPCSPRLPRPHAFANHIFRQKSDRRATRVVVLVCPRSRGQRVFCSLRSRLCYHRYSYTYCEYRSSGRSTCTYTYTYLRYIYFSKSSKHQTRTGGLSGHCLDVVHRTSRQGLSGFLEAKQNWNKHGSWPRCVNCSGRLSIAIEVVCRMQENAARLVTIVIYLCLEARSSKSSKPRLYAVPTEINIHM